jgi:hypothetical protein
MNRITSTITEGNNVPLDQQRDSWKKNANPWTVTLRYQGRQYTFPFWTGTGWTSKPNTFDAAHCVLSDASGFENSQGFEDWASDYGYDTDSRDAEDIYRATERVHRNIMRLLGDDYTTLVYMDEETLQERTQ